jgi:hypothetical protein
MEHLFREERHVDQDCKGSYFHGSRPRRRTEAATREGGNEGEGLRAR